MNRFPLFLTLLSGLAIAGCSDSGSSSKDILVQPKQGPFRVMVTTTGELQAKRSTRILGPRGAQSADIYQMKIQRIIPEGTVVEPGDFIAQLDQSDVNSKLQESNIALDKALSQLTQVQLDTALTLSEARDNIVNLKYSLQEQQYEIEQSKFEAPATQNKLQLALQKAQRTLDQAISNYEKRIAQSAAKVQEASADVNKERRKVKELMELMQEFTILAPEAGMLTYYREWNGRKRQTGSTFQVWNPTVAMLPDLTNMESITYVNEIDIRKIQPELEVAITLDAMPDKSIKGIIKEVANMGEQRPNSDSKVFQVIITVLDVDSTLRPSMTTANEILVADRESALYVPLECLHAHDSTSFVFVQQGASIIKQEVETGLINDNDAEILAGLDMDSKIYLSMPADTSRLAFEYLKPQSASPMVQASDE
ncbi:RND transporter [Pontibacter sp. G13]|uniref:efflux RND transporter periplasmic adaptor subunit n=1 Tax=Pontibacter sp. G13 TaxID=3074898 RepID=UPI00288AC6D8|nr:RND transporter [Pontibacter sp. G13]WNJ17451.1 RND transporter [Pontibacter sp. G13]